MIRHIVLFRFVADATARQIDDAGHALLALQGTIADVRDVAFGLNLASSAAEWSHVLVVTADDMAAVERYLKHPAHVAAVADYVAPIREARLAVDVEAA